MTGRLVGIVLVAALIAGCYALARGHGPMTYYMDDNALLSRYLADTETLASDSQPASASVATVKHESPLLQSQD
jgi:hypothetical protein